ncbi:MAG TPA: substrate-binding domain-containing protein [Holophaga sp.]|nr:substrate-binding domain-containing protein [Holophaga sp.]
MNWRTLCLAVLASLALQAQAEIRLATGITPALNIFNRVKPAFEKATGIKLWLRDARSAEAWGLLDKGEADAAAGGLTWEDWKASIKAKKLRMPSEEEITRIQIGTDTIQVLTTADVLLLTLSKEDLAGIFTGKVKSWKEIGGPDAPIFVLLDPDQAATNDTFRSQIMDGQAFGKFTWGFPKGVTVVQALENSTFAICFAPKAAQEAIQVNSPVTPNITRPIFLVTKGKPSAPVQKLLDWLKTPEAKALIVE